MPKSAIVECGACGRAWRAPYDSDVAETFRGWEKSRIVNPWPNPCRCTNCRLGCRELVDRYVKLKRAVVTRGGDRFERDVVMRVASTWRGRFTLTTIGPPRRCVRHLDRDTFSVLP